MSRREQRKTWIFAIAFTIMGLVSLSTGETYGLIFLVIAAIDWFRLITKGMPRQSGKTVDYRELARKEEERKEQLRQQREQKQQEAVRLYPSQEPHRLEKDALNTARRRDWLRRSRDAIIYLYNPDDPTKDIWQFGPTVTEELFLTNHPGKDMTATFHKENGIWYVQAENGADIYVNGSREKERCSNCADVEIDSRLYGYKIPLLPGDCFTVTCGTSVLTWFLGTVKIYPDGLWKKYTD